MKLTTNYAVGGMVASFEYEGTPQEIAEVWGFVEVEPAKQPVQNVVVNDISFNGEELKRLVRELFRYNSVER